MSNALHGIKEGATPQRERARADQVENNAGGFVFAVTPKARLERFLILGTDGGTYYQTERDLTKENYDFLKEYAESNPREMIDTIVDVSDQGRAPKNSPAIFALAVALTFGTDKAYAQQAVNKVARTGTHIFEFAQFIDNLGGWGRAKRKAVGGWYTGKTVDDLAYQAVKYRQRNGWTHKDLLRLSHPEGLNPNIGNFILGKEVAQEIPLVKAFNEAQKVTKVSEAKTLMQETRLPWEAFPTTLHKDKEFWETLFYANNMPLGAVLRNITRFARLGMFNDMTFTADVAKRLQDREQIGKARLHPLNFLVAKHVHQNGQQREPYGYAQKDWTASARILDSLEKGFYTAFQEVEPTGKRTMLALDVSGSMGSGVMGLNYLSAREAAAVMAMVTAKAEDKYIIRGFTSEGDYWTGGASKLTDLGIDPSQSLEQIVGRTSRLPFGATDCALPMLWASENSVDVDTFVVYTDSETWAGRVQPFEALKKYRRDSGINAKLVVVGMTSTGFSIADPSDPGMLDVVGFDTAAPRVIADFSRN